MKKSFKYRIQANTEYIRKAERWLELCHFLYNSALSQRISIYRQNKGHISKYEQMRQLPELKEELTEYKQVNSQTLQEVIERLDKAYQGFFRRFANGEKPGFPRFKGKNRYDSFTLKQTGWKLEGKCLSIRHIGFFKLRMSRPIEGDIKTLTICRNTDGKWFAVFSCDNVPVKPLPETRRFIGIDVGLKSFLTTSEGIKIVNPRFFKKSQELLAIRQQRLSLRKKGSKRRNKARVLVAKTHEKIHNQRRDFHFKVAGQLLKENDTIAIEKMNSWNNNLNRSMRDAAWFGFFSILKHKAEEAGREIVEVPAKDTSQFCSQCGARVPKDLSVRVHSCPFCHLVIDRDINAALNIRRLGQSLQASYVT